MSTVTGAFPGFHGHGRGGRGEGDLVAGRLIWRGTNQGLFLGLAPTDKPVTVAAFHMVRLSAGSIVEWWGSADLFGA
jgi:predicted ester cyclase